MGYSIEDLETLRLDAMNDAGKNFYRILNEREGRSIRFTPYTNTCQTSGIQTSGIGYDAALVAVFKIPFKDLPLNLIHKDEGLVPLRYQEKLWWSCIVQARLKFGI